MPLNLSALKGGIMAEETLLVSLSELNTMEIQCKKCGALTVTQFDSKDQERCSLHNCGVCMEDLQYASPTMETLRKIRKTLKDLGLDRNIRFRISPSTEPPKNKETA